MNEPAGELTRDDLHVWQIPLHQSGDVVRMLEGHLSVIEARRAIRYRREMDRRRHVVAHGALRELLAEYTAQTPRDVSFGHTAIGKPFLIDNRREKPLRFSLSHSGDWAVVAVALSTEVGVDIEQIDSEVSVEAVAERFFSRSEFEALRNAPSEQRTEFFFTAWTRKEAYLKARGEGIADRLRSFSVSVNPEQIPVLLTDSKDPPAVRGWRIYDVDIACGYAAALAAEGDTHQIHLMHWTARFP